MQGISVSKFEITDLSPKVKNPKLQKLVPTTLKPIHCEFTIKGVSNAVSNGIRRTICDEFPVLSMTVDYNSLTTTEPFIIPEMVLKRFMMIPLDQKCPENAVFSLHVTNSSPLLRDVKSSEIHIERGPKQLPFNGNYTLFTLAPGKSCHITDIKVAKHHGYVVGEGMCCIACNTSSTSVDQIPLNTFEIGEDGKPIGIPSRVSNPRVWKIGFNTNGSMEPHALIRSACEDIIRRVKATQELFYTIENNAQEYTLVVPGESHTIGNLFYRTIIDLYPAIPNAVYSVTNMERNCVIKVTTLDDINVILTNVVKKIIEQYTVIKSQI